jgi:hypothetical protein
MFRELQQQQVWHSPPTQAPHWLHQSPAMGAKQKSGHTKKKDWKFSPPERTWGAARLKFKANSAFSVWPVRTCLATMGLQNQNESISHCKSFMSGMCYNSRDYSAFWETNKMLCGETTNQIRSGMNSSQSGWPIWLGFHIPNEHLLAIRQLSNQETLLYACSAKHKNILLSPRFSCTIVFFWSSHRIYRPTAVVIMP